MAGQMGNEQVTEECLEVLRVDSERNLLLIKGAIPGAKNGFVKVILSDRKNSVNAQISKQLAEENAVKAQEIEAAEAVAEEAPVVEEAIDTAAEEAPVETKIEAVEAVKAVETESDETENKADEKEETEDK
jgi:large subunit ribosomal protein L3